MRAYDKSVLLDGVYYSKPGRTIGKLLKQLKIKDIEIERLTLKKASIEMKECEISELRHSVNKLTAEKSKWVRSQKKLISN